MDKKQIFTTVLLAIIALIGAFVAVIDNSKIFYWLEFVFIFSIAFYLIGYRFLNYLSIELSNISKKFKKFINTEIMFLAKVDGEFRAFNYVLFVEIPFKEFPFIKDCECSIDIFPETSQLTSLSKQDMKRIEGNKFSLPIDKKIVYGKSARIDTFVINTREETFKIFKSERYSRPPIFGFGKYIFGVEILGRNIFQKKVSDKRYIFVDYREGKELPEIIIKRFSEIEKVKRSLIRDYENRHVVSFI